MKRVSPFSDMSGSDTLFPNDFGDLFVMLDALPVAKQTVPMQLVFNNKDTVQKLDISNTYNRHHHKLNIGLVYRK